MLQLMLYIFLAGFFILEITLLRILFANETSKSLNKLVGDRGFVQDNNKLMNINRNLVINKVPNRIKD
jgi:hypothetical protein